METNYWRRCKNERFYQFEKIKEKDRQFLFEKIIHSIEFSNPYENSAEKNPEIIDIVKGNMKYPGEFTRQFLLMLLTVLFNTFIP